MSARHLSGNGSEIMANEQKFFATSRGLGPHASRRGLLQAGWAIGTLALSQRAALGQSGGAHVHMPELGVAKVPVVAAMDQPMVEPEVRRSVNGVLSTSLRCAYAYRDIGGMRLYLRSFEDGLGPTLRMKPGETLKIRLINDLPPNRDMMPSNPSYPHQFNNTNFHFHGAHCSPSGIADNVMRSMVPGKSYDIEITLPADHTRGTYWYHPHHHGSADVQVAGGMAGAIIVEGDFADVPEIAQARERVMLLAEVVFDAYYMIEDFGTLFPETATRFLAINGQRRPTIDMRPGEVQRWRLVGSQYQDNMLLELDQHRLNLIACDGIQLGALQEMKQLLITPGQRADVLVQAGGPGTYELNAIPTRVMTRPPDRWPAWSWPASRCDEATGRTAQAAARDDPRQRNHRPAHIGLRGNRAAEQHRRTGRNTPSPWTVRPSIPRASTSGSGWARWRNGRSATPTGTMTICFTSTPTRSRSSRSAVNRRSIGRGAIPWSCRGRPKAAAPSSARVSSTTPASS
jgi:FtsP/CotA-like multicopper oxidase with cupredoxin domain